MTTYYKRCDDPWHARPRGMAYPDGDLKGFASCPSCHKIRECGLVPVAAGALLIEDGAQAARIVGREVAAIAVKWGIPGYRMDDDEGHRQMGWKVLRAAVGEGDR